MQKVWFRKQTGWWYASIAKGSNSYDQVKLVKAPNTKEGKQLAEDQLIQELALRQHHRKQEMPVSWLLVGDVLTGFLIYSQKNHEAETAEWYSWMLNPVITKLGKVRIAELRKRHIHDYLATKDYNSTSEGRCIGAIKRAFNWAVEEEYIPKNPIAHVRKPKALTRDRTLSPEERVLILNSIKDDAFKIFVRAMSLTGCRPSEVARVTAENVDLARGIWIFQKHKTNKKTGKPRIIYLCPEAIDLTQSLLEKRPLGPLFLNLRGQPWNRNAIRCRFRRLRDLHPSLKGVISYTYRHSFGTDALESGIPDSTVAALMGHSDPSTLHRFYNKLSQRTDHLREAASKINQPLKSEITDEPRRDAA